MVPETLRIHLASQDAIMNTTRFFGVWAVVLICTAVSLPTAVAAQETMPTSLEPASSSAAHQGAAPVLPQPSDLRERLERAESARRGLDDLAPSKALRRGNVGTVAREMPRVGLWADLLPELSASTLAWIAVVVILLLTLQVRPLRSWHNLDGLVLALTALLFLLRGTFDVPRAGPAGQAVQWWAYLLLTAAALYWLMRGLWLLLAKTVPALTPNISQRAMFVLIVAGLFVAGARIVNAPVSDGSRDGLIGGLCMAETGKLPYGDTLGHDARSPLVYALHAGAVKLVEPVNPAEAETPWTDRSVALHDASLTTADVITVWLVNGLLFVLLLAALAGIGHRMHSTVLGQILVVIACVFPGVLECVARPEIMLPAALLAWSIAFVTVPRVGGLLAVLTLVLAGLAWPWAWLALPAMLAYFLRRQWQALGAVIGLLGGMAAALVGFTALVAPMLPRAGGALRDAGITPAYAARLSDDGIPVIEHYRPSETIDPTFKRWIWQPLLNRDELSLDSASTQLALPNGVNAAGVKYRDVTATGAARAVLQRQYRAVLAQAPLLARTSASLRTVLEATWKPEVTPATPVLGVWDLWAAEQPGSQWTLARRIAKILVGLLALLVALALIRSRRPQLHRLIGGLLVVCGATLVISMTGAVANWVWLMPVALAALAVRTGSLAVSRLETPARERPALDLGPAPRITVER